MQEQKVRSYLKDRIWKTEKNWITSSTMNELLDQGIESIKRNLEEGNITEVTEEVMDIIAFKLIDQLH